jgi:transcriptional regulator with XRE-family HTH domain
MGRKRATFREGIGGEQRCYAQALRDIRDLRGETQQELGRLFGWSVSMVSRFEAARERPDRATHERYCALAPVNDGRKLTPWRRVKTDPLGDHCSSVVAAGTRPKSRSLSR